MNRVVPVLFRISFGFQIAEQFCRRAKHQIVQTPVRSIKYNSQLNFKRNYWKNVVCKCNKQYWHIALDNDICSQLPPQFGFPTNTFRSFIALNMYQLEGITVQYPIFVMLLFEVQWILPFFPHFTVVISLWYQHIMSVW